MAGSHSYYDETIVVEAATGLSILGSLFILWSFIIFQRSKEARERPDIPLSTLVFCLGLSDLFGGVCWMVQGRVDGTACEAFGYGSVFFSISSYMFSLCVALAIYLLVCKKVHISRNGFIAYNALSWGVGLAFLIGISASSRIKARLNGSSGCWFNRHDRAQLAFWDMPLISAWIVSLVVYSVTYNRIRQMSTRKARRKVYVRLMLFALVFLPTVLPDLVVSVLFAFGVHVEPWIAYAVSLLAASRGFWDALVFGYNVEMEGKVAKLLCGGCSCCPCCRQPQAPKPFKEFKMTSRNGTGLGSAGNAGDVEDLKRPLTSSMDMASPSQASLLPASSLNSGSTEANYKPFQPSGAPNGGPKRPPNL